MLWCHHSSIPGLCITGASFCCEHCFANVWRNNASNESFGWFFELGLLCCLVAGCVKKFGRCTSWVSIAKQTIQFSFYVSCTGAVQDWFFSFTFSSIFFNEKGMRSALFVDFLLQLSGSWSDCRCRNRINLRVIGFTELVQDRQLMVRLDRLSFFDRVLPFHVDQSWY